MPVGGPNFSPFPYERLPRITRRAVATETAIARWIAVTPLKKRVEQLVGGPVRVRLVGVREAYCGSPIDATLASDRVVGDPHAALAEARISGLSIVVAASSRPIRAIAQRLLGGPEELAAPRPLSTAEHAIWALVLATLVADNGIAADVWPIAEIPREALRIEFALDVAGMATTVVALCPPELVVRTPPPRSLPRWSFDVGVIVARCVLRRAAVAALAVRDVVIVERALALAIGDGEVRLDAAPGSVEAAVASGYVRRAMAMPDDAHLELTVQLGTTRLSLRQLGELAIGQVVPLGRPLAGPYEIRAGGRTVGEGELVDVEGELGVRIVSLSQE